MLEINLNLLKSRIINVKGTSKRVAHKRKIPDGKLKDNIVSVKSLADLGMTGGIHESYTFLITYKDESHSIYKVMPERNIKGEVTAYEVNNIIGWNLVPETTFGDFKGHGQGSCQKWIENGKDGYIDPSDPDSTEITDDHLEDLSKIFLMDTLLGNWDRREPNVVIKNDRVYMIDNEYIGVGTTEKFLYMLGDEGKKSSSNPMYSWLDSSGVKPKVFKDHVVGNMSNIIDNAPEIILHIEKSGLSKDAVECVKTNLEKIKNYYRLEVGNTST